MNRRFNMKTKEEIKEVFNRMMNPQKIEDYGLSLSIDEIMQLPEAVNEIKSWKTINQLMDEDNTF